jgi:hypothetical protein
VVVELIAVIGRPSDFLLGRPSARSSPLPTRSQGSGSPPRSGVEMTYVVPAATMA